VPWDKGKAIARLRETFPQATLTMFFGDDLTDEDGFNVVQEAGGIAVFVGPARQPTRALYRVDSPQEVAQTLLLMYQSC
jgi:trehalose 6-phosphate phosphatase